MSRSASNRFKILGVLGVGVVLGYIAASGNPSPNNPSNAAEPEKSERTKNEVGFLKSL